ncbi:MAG: hypothetical protein RL654_2701 [Pseudomonadota bacterium]|jgi:hypothetical protein
MASAACTLALALVSALPPFARPAGAQATLGTTLGGAAGWPQLTPAEQKILLPLRDQWADIEPLRRQKWRDIAAIYPTLPAEQQERLRSRMAEWAKMTPAQRNTARLHFGEVRQVPPTERQARWEAWQQLPEAQRRSIGTQAASAPLLTGTVPAAVRKTSAAAQAPQIKSNIVATPVRTTPQPVAPGTVQAGPGASTRPISKATPTPPRHQPVGLPKIAATPGFVDRTTLLPSRGPQGAAAAVSPTPVITLPAPAPAAAPPAVVASAPLAATSASGSASASDGSP